MAAWRTILLATAVVLPCACSSEPSTVAADPDEPDRIDVVAAFYPLQFVTERVGGDAVSVTNLTPDGSEPHELELSARDAGHLQDADVVVYLDGFAPALDDTIDDVDATSAGTGFKFSDYAATALIATVQRALTRYADPAGWQRIVREGMRRDHSWQRAAGAYLELYREMTPPR